MVSEWFVVRTIRAGTPWRPYKPIQRGRKARKLKGLPKLWWEADDDRAYDWFLKHPDPRIQMTLDYFPHSVKLRKEDESAANVITNPVENAP